MQKKTKTKVLKKEAEPLLPQNIVPVGDRVLENKNIYIHQRVYEDIHAFAGNKTDNEHGGILVGYVLNEMGKENTIIEGFIEAKYDTATPTTLTFTHDTWDYFHKELERKYKNKKIVGWIHTHPNFGIFLSENDKFIQENFFTDTNQVAYVVDPIQEDEGFFFWVDGKLERCPGFYLFDKNGVKIKQRRHFAEETEEDETVGSFDKLWTAVLAMLILLAAILMISQTVALQRMSHRIRALEEQVQMMQQGALILPYASGQRMPMVIIDRQDELTDGDKETAPEKETADAQTKEGAEN